VDEYITRHPGTPLAQELKTKVEWCRQQPVKTGARRRPAEATREEQLARGRELLSYQRPDGAFPFDPDKRHYVKDDFVVAREYLEPMGLVGDTALDLCVVPAMELLQLADATGEDQFRQAARRALDFCLPQERPEGGDYWETPLHSPNLLAAGHAAVAYYLAFRAFKDERYRLKAVHWVRALIPFTHLWEPPDKPMLYNTKPCLCSSDWYFANWVRDHVQWEVLATFSLSIEHKIDWGKEDPGIDWHCFHRGVTLAAVRWMTDHREEKWLPHNLPHTLEMYRRGEFDGCYPDTHNSITGNYGGAMITPDGIAANLLKVMEY
jgi:hypothetical protein